MAQALAKSVVGERNAGLTPLKTCGGVAVWRIIVADTATPTANEGLTVDDELAGYVNFQRGER